MRDHPDAVDAAAARWVARLDAAPDDAALAEAAARWCERDPRHMGALLRARAVWSGIGEARERPRHPGRFSRRRALIAGGGMAIAAALLGVIWVDGHGATGFETAVGERRVAHLGDGSTILLNTASKTHVTMTRDSRLVVLDDGEAWFRVARDHARPFVVSAGDIRVRAVGTAFAVRRFVGHAQVTVTEGRVRIWSIAAPERFLTLDAGRGVTIADSAGATHAVVGAAKADETLAWRRGEIVLDGMTLGDAAAEFNRYNRRQMSVEAPLAERRIVGWFRTDDIDGFARSAAAMTGARIERDAGDLRIVN